jgi:hypothetical protein
MELFLVKRSNIGKSVNAHSLTPNKNDIRSRFEKIDLAKIGKVCLMQISELVMFIDVNN